MTRRLHFIAIVPPPRNGMTTISECMLAAFTKTHDVIERTVSRPPWLPVKAWPAYRQAVLSLQCMLALISARRGDEVYFVLDSGGGLWGNRLIHLPVLAASKMTVRVHHHVYSYINEYDPRIAAIVKMLGERARHIFLCQCMKTDFERQYNVSVKSDIISNARFVDRPDTPPDRIGRSDKTLGFLGNITREKGIGLFMETVRTLEDSGSPVNAVIAGPVTEAALKAEIDAFIAEAPGSREYVGPVYGAQKAAFYNQIDVLLFPTQYRNEAQPVTIFEALAYKLPVLATNRGCIKEQLPAEWVFEEDDFVSRAVEAIRL